MIPEAPPVRDRLRSDGLPMNPRERMLRDLSLHVWDHLICKRTPLTPLSYTRDGRTGWHVYMLPLSSKEKGPGGVSCAGEAVQYARVLQVQ